MPGWTSLASPELRKLLDAGRGALPSPIRSEIFGAQRFAQHGRSLGLTHRASATRSVGPTFFPRLQSNVAVLREAHTYIGMQASNGYDVSPAAEWLLDNFHLVESQLQEVHEAMPASYFRKLPYLLDAPLQGLPRIYGVAWAFVAHTDGAFDESLLVDFLDAYQESRELKLSEIWALPTTLRVVLIENLRRLAERVASNKAARELANLAFDQIGDLDIAQLEDTRQMLAERGVERVFLAQLAQRFHDWRVTEDGSAHEAIQAWLLHALPDMAAALAWQSAEQAADNLSVSNGLTSLRVIGDADWADIIGSTNVLTLCMEAIPLFVAEARVTRDQTLHAIEKLARRSGRSEVSVAQVLLECMRTADPAIAGRALAQYWLMGDGRPELRLALGMSKPWVTMPSDVLRRAAFPLYMGVLAAWTAVLLWVGLGDALYAQGARSTFFWIGLILLAFPASEGAVAITNRLIAESLKPRHLPRFAWRDGIPPAHQTMVVVPCMLVSQASVSALLRQLEIHFLANPERHAQFALLSDWADAPTEHMLADAALLQQAVDGIAALNARYTTDADPQSPSRFLLLHRLRTHSKTEQCWMGWERKRGKLEQLITELAQGYDKAFLDFGPISATSNATRYVLTLDSDTQLPPGRLRELVAVAAHPCNLPQLARDGKSVASGYAILQPRVLTPLPESARQTPFHWLFSGQSGMDPYSAASSEVYQDMFSEGTFTGKGLLHVQAVHALLSQKLPVGQILSHDLLEGALARCGSVSDLTVLEDAPSHADVAASRIHRWMRGDWQLLPVVLASIFGRGSLRIPAVSVWKMLDNLRRSLMAPASLACLFLAFLGDGLQPARVLWVVAIALCAGAVMGAAAGFLSYRPGLAKVHFYREALTGLLRALLGGVWQFAQLLQSAMMALDATGRALYRMFWSHRHLLQWTTAEAAQRQAHSGWTRLLRQHWKEPFVAMVLLACVLLVPTPVSWLGGAICVLWAASPVWTWCVSRSWRIGVQAPLAAQDRLYLEGIARDTWRLFERVVGPEDNHLPPDNLQTTPQEILAHRTSPTNMGMYLLSVACARQFGWIGTLDLLGRLEATLATLQRLDRHRGHFYNWYDTQSCAVLTPAYVSTVDSGNFSALALTTAQACTELASEEQEIVWVQRLQALAGAFTALAWQADFRFLYNDKRHLFHIGYRVEERQWDSGFYDLLASESRLTSIVAIAKGDAPVRHWASLGRLFFANGRHVGLRSWTGSMFEYLMPTLLMDEPHGSALREASATALVEQMAFAARQGVPWGISESAYAARDHTLAFQYAPQGVPRLALRRTPADELVVAPYATALAAMVSPHLAAQNYRALEALGARSELGFMDALDFSPARKPPDKACATVETYMAHHQGMTLVALANVLLHGCAQRWGMAAPAMRAMESLLQDRIPREVSHLTGPERTQQQLLQQRRRPPSLLREVLPQQQAVLPTHLLSNGRYGVALRANGAGWSHWGATGVTRERDDALQDDCGNFIYLRQGDAPLVSVTHHPAADPQASYRCVHHADRMCFDANWPQLHVRTTVWVSPEDDVEFRQIELQNLGDTPLALELISAMEVTLAPPSADEAHPAFSNLFVQAQWLASHQAILFKRTPRLDTEPKVHMAHFLAFTDASAVTLRVQTDRQQWFGRNRGPAHPQARLDQVPTTGLGAPADLQTGLDPVACLAVALRIGANTKLQLTFATAVSDHGDTLRAVVDKYRQSSHIRRASLMSATLAGIRLRALRMSPDNFAAQQLLTSALTQTLSRARAPRDPALAGAPRFCDRRVLWRFGVSGDRPVLLVSIGALHGLGMLRSLTQAMGLWIWGGIACDLVILNAEPVSYAMELQREIEGLRERHEVASRARIDVPTPAFHVLRMDALSEPELSTLKALARLHLQADGRPLSHHLQEWAERHALALSAREGRSPAVVALRRTPGAPGPAPHGHFQNAGSEFRFDVSEGIHPTRPWINVLANPDFGAHISEAGGGYTWARNSRMGQLTAWSNDPVRDTAAEWFLIQERRSGDVWSIAPNAWGADTHYQVVHGQGYTSIRHRHRNLQVHARWCVDAEASVKELQITVTNTGERMVHLRVAGVVAWLLGARRADRATVFTRFSQEHCGPNALHVLRATQSDDAGGLGGGTAFLSLQVPQGCDADWTCDRRECFDLQGRMLMPDRWGQSRGEGLDPCAALSLDMDLHPGGTSHCVFLLGYADSPEESLQLARQSAGQPGGLRSEQIAQRWDRLLGAATFKTPDPLFDALVNRWLLYQAVSCRLWAKSGFYQAGGATGFRDQLQDAMALVWAAPDMLRAQIVLCASRQFEQGDVQHWWHAPGGAGVRTHFSDDLLWLPHACLHYLRATGDPTLLDESVPFLEGMEILEGAEDAYFTPTISAQRASVYEHAARAIDHSLRTGVHGLPLMGGGDWNDGMNRVGDQGQGESVWLAWFLCGMVPGFAALARKRGQDARALLWEQAMQGWQRALEGAAWDGQWFRRAFFDDGSPLGSHTNPEGQQDLIAQAWSVLSNAASPHQQVEAMASAETMLVDTQAGLLKLLAPPFAKAIPAAGYIQAYPPGVRENGGQYSHAGVWALMAAAKLLVTQPDALHDPDRPYRYFTYLSPAHRAVHSTRGPAYGLEPYVMAADVYSAPPYVGRGGWSWYTGAAAWMHRAAVESIMGLQQTALHITLTPCLPLHWPRAEITLARGAQTMRFIVMRGEASSAIAAAGVAGAQLLAAGQLLHWASLPAESCWVVAIA
ncbi:MAG: carbohydrate-binding protein [Rhodoferax sp.]|nr:carbohydrate-binding protein [Rhodoferax sp.]